MQGFMILAIIGTEKELRHFSILLDMKFCQSQWSVCRSKVPSHGVYL